MGGAPAIQDVVGGQIAASVNCRGGTSPVAHGSSATQCWPPPCALALPAWVRSLCARKWRARLRHPGVLRPSGCPPKTPAVANATGRADPATPWPRRNCRRPHAARASSCRAQVTPRELDAMVRADLAKWAPIVAFHRLFHRQLKPGELNGLDRTCGALGTAPMEVRKP